MSAYNNAVDAAEWCRKTDRYGDTNFQRVFRWANALSMERGRSSITSSDMRSLFKMTNAHSSAVSRWLLMADWGLAGYLTITHVEELDSDENRADFAALFKGFGERPTSIDHIVAKERWREFQKETSGGKHD